MSKFSRRKLFFTGLYVGGGASGLAAAAALARRYGLVPPDCGGIYGPGETLSYAAHRLFARDSLAREFSRGMISNPPFPNQADPLGKEFERLRDGGFSGWRLAVDGMVARPASFSVADVQGFPRHSQITQLQCEEGWSYIAEWTGARLSHILDVVGALPQARYVVYSSFERDTWDSIDMADARHPQTFIAYGMNGEELPVKHGGPLRMRLPRQMGYKNIKYITRLTVTDSLKGFGKGMGSVSAQYGYAWYAGI
jgi:DMSO/TMAO reductase YedYZ molybdopterin-dependent catalytic subunit